MVLQGVKTGIYAKTLHNQFDYPQENLLQYLDKQSGTSGSSWTDQTNGYDARFIGPISNNLWFYYRYFLFCS